VKAGGMQSNWLAETEFVWERVQKWKTAIGETSRLFVTNKGYDLLTTADAQCM
jgi:hypothetical protein